MLLKCYLFDFNIEMYNLLVTEQYRLAIGLYGVKLQTKNNYKTSDSYTFIKCL